MGRPTVLVTGGTGFLGRAVVQELRKRGAIVRTLSRRTAESDGDQHVKGSVLDRSSCTRALQEVRQVIHLATGVDLAPRSPAEVFAVQVEGTRTLLQEARDRGVTRFIHVSSSGTVGLSEDPSFVATEESPYAESLARSMAYYSAKIFAEKMVLAQAGERKAPVLVANPSLLLGPGATAISDGDLVWRFLKRAIPATPPGIVSVVDVRCAARTLVDMLDRGQVGQRYLLGAVNLSFAQLFERLEQVSGVRAPRLRMTPAMGRALARTLDRAPALFMQSLHRWRAFRTDLERGRLNWSIDSRKARSELGFAPRPLEHTLADTISWVHGQQGEHGLAPAEASLLARTGRPHTKGTTA